MDVMSQRRVIRLDGIGAVQQQMLHAARAVEVAHRDLGRR
jgi:hypothetical protein